MPTSDKLTEAWLRLHPSMLLFGLGKAARGTIVPLLFTGYMASNSPTFFTAIMVTFFGLAMAAQLLRYFSYRYCFGDGKINIREGIFTRKIRTIPVERIHNINTSQNLIARLLKVVRLDLETAGGGNAEASLPTISIAAASALSEYVHAEKASSAPAKEEPAVDCEQELHKMTFADVVLAGATSNRVGMIAFGFLVFSQYQDFVSHEQMTQWLNSGAQGVAGSTRENLIFFGLITFTVLLLGAWLFGIMLALIRWFRFTLSYNGADLKIRTGLFTLREYTIPRNRIQALRCTTSALRRPFGLFQIQVRSAGHVGMQDKSRLESDMLVPLIGKQRIALFAGFAFPQSAWDQVDWQPVNVYTRTRQWFLLLCFVALIALLVGQFAPAFIWQGPWLALFFVGCIPLSFVVAQLNWRQTAWAHDPHFVYIKTGFLGLQYWVIPTAKIQNVALSQTPAQRTRQLASLHLDVAGSSSAAEPIIPSINLQQAWLLFCRFGHAF